MEPYRDSQAAHSPFMKELRQHVLNNLDNEQFGATTLADLQGISRSQLHRKLILNTGKPASRFIRDIRLEEALTFLEDTDHPVSEIAYRVGFNSPSYFHKCFHDRYQITPREAKEKIIAGKPIYPPTKSTNQLEGFFYRWFVVKPYIPFAIAILFLLSAAGLFYMVNRAPTSIPNDKTIAVLPFDNLSENEGNQHFAAGFVDDLLYRLSQIPNFKVVSKASSGIYRNNDSKHLQDIASELKASFIIQGSVQQDKAQNRFKVNVQLINALNDDLIWSKQYKPDATDVFQAQQEVSAQVASELRALLDQYAPKK